VYDISITDGINPTCAKTRLH